MLTGFNGTPGGGSGQIQRLVFNCCPFQVCIPESVFCESAVAYVTAEQIGLLEIGAAEGVFGQIAHKQVGMFEVDAAHIAFSNETVFHYRIGEIAAAEI